MSHRFQKHYTVEEARELLPQLRSWLTQLAELQENMKQVDDRLSQLLASGSDALGGHTVNRHIWLMSEFQKLMREFTSREIQIKDLQRGLVDFPALIGGKEVFLCWEKDEDDIEFWHELDSGYANRERL